MLFFARTRCYFVGLAVATFFFFGSVIVSLAQTDWKKGMGKDSSRGQKRRQDRGRYSGAGGAEKGVGGDF